MRLKLFASSLLLVFTLQSAVAQVRINELCSKNDSLVADADSAFVDWIELYNASGSPYDLAGHFLSSDPQNLQEWAFPSISLQPGEFLLVFASGKNRFTPDLHTNFRLSRSGETLTLTSASGTVIDQELVGILRPNHSYGAFPDGGQNTYYFRQPTPGAANTTTAMKGYAPNPGASLLQGFYENPITVFFSTSEPGLNLHYTLDGSTPTLADPVQTAPLQLDTTSIVRIRAFGDSLIPSEVATNTYFIADTSRLPILSLSTDPGYLFDADTGIYVFGPNADTVAPYWGANFWLDKEIPVHAEFYDEDRVLGFEQDLGLKIHGWVQSRAQPMKSLNMVARSEYSDPVVNYRLFPEKRVRQFKRFVLRNSGGDFSHCHFRDGFLHQLMITDGLHLELLGYRPTVVYINGRFWGIHNLREKTGDDYLIENYTGITPDSLDVLENDNMVDVGSFEIFNQMYTELMASDMTTDADYSVAASRWDVENLADYYIAETFWNNFDWPYWNVLFWRERKDGAKWRYFLVDLDVSLNAEGWASAPKDNLGRILRTDLDPNRHLDILHQFLRNDGFRSYFINRYADLINTSFSTSYTTGRMDALIELLEPDMHRHFERWGGNNIPFWHDYHINHLTRQYLIDKPGIARNQVQEAFDLEAQVPITIKVWPPQAARVQINTITADTFPWNGIYFNGNPISITVLPRPGYDFKHWQAMQTFSGPNENPTLSYNFTKGDTLVAFFDTHTNKLSLAAYPNPANETVRLSFALDTIDRVEITLFDIHGKAVHSQNNRLSGGLQEVAVPVQYLPAGIYLARVRTSNQLATRKIIVSGR